MNARNVNQGASLSEAIMAIPPVTRLLLFATILSGALYTFGVVDAVHFLFIPSKIINEFQIYRLVLPVIFAGAGGTSADFLWMVMIGTALLWPIAYYFQIFVLSQPMVYMIMYVWSRRFPDEQRNMFGVFSLKVAYIPWFYVAIHVLMGNSITPILVGIAVGHIYYYIIEVLPRTSNVDLVKTPIFCSKIINYLTGGSQGASPRPAATQQGPNAQRPLNQRANQGFPNVGGGYNWGNGRTLGTQ